MHTTGSRAADRCDDLQHLSLPSLAPYYGSSVVVSTSERFRVAWECSPCPLTAANVRSFIVLTGNLGRVDYISEFEFDLFVRPDTCNPRFRVWFNFTVENVCETQVSILLSCRL